MLIISLEKAIVVRIMMKTMISIVVVIMANFLIITGAAVTIIPRVILAFKVMMILLSVSPSEAHMHCRVVYAEYRQNIGGR